MAKQAILGESRERDLGYEFGPHPVDVMRLRATWCVHEDGLLVAQGRELAVEVAQRAFTKAGADTSSLHEFVSRVRGQQQCAQESARASWVGESDHDELLPLAAFHLYPAAAAPGAIGSFQLFRDDSFEAHADRLREKGWSLTNDVVAPANHAGEGRWNPRKQFGE